MAIPHIIYQMWGENGQNVWNITNVVITCGNQNKNVCSHQKTIERG
jgi:hypothetical protein